MIAHLKNFLISQKGKEQMEKTLVLIKPDATKDEVWLHIIDIYRSHGLHVEQTRLIPCMPDELVRTHYHEQVSKPFFPEILEYMTSGPTIALILTGENAIQKVRDLNGATRDASSETIRGKFSQGSYQNCVHGSDSVASAEKEIALFFGGID